MFEQSTLLSTPRRWWATCIGFGAEAVLVAVVALVPLIWPRVIPPMALVTTLAAPGPPPAPTRKGGGAHPVRRPAATRVFHSAGRIAPGLAPAHAIQIVDPPPEAGDFGLPEGVAGGSGDGILGGVAGSVVASVRPAVVERPPEPVVPKPPAVAPAGRLVITGGKVNPAVAISRPEPLYPPLARSMRVSGVVELIGVIGTDGRIKELQVKSGHPLLARAALEAVARWIYKPTLLNGVPVEVEAPITITFRLSN